MSAHPIDTTTLADRLRASGLNWLNKDLDRLYVQYPGLFTREELIDNRLGVHSNIINENIELRAHIGELLKENDSLRLTNVKLNETEKLVEALKGENQQTTITLNEKTAEANNWKKMFTTADESNTNNASKVSILAKENQHLYTVQQHQDDELAAFEKLKTQHNHLQAEYAALTQTKDRLVVLNNEREQQCAAQIQEREKTISNLNVTIGQLQAQATDYETYKATNAGLVAENQRLSEIIGDNNKTIDGLRFGLAQLAEVENNLSLTAEERAKLNAELTQKLAEVDNLKLSLYQAQGNAKDKDAWARAHAERSQEVESLRAQIVSLQLENSRIPELQARVALLAADNERLSASLVEKIKSIDEWSVRYSSLESLYLNIKDTTEQLDYVKKRYETVVAQSEKVDPRLRASMELRNYSVVTAESSPDYTGLKKSITMM